MARGAGPGTGGPLPARPASARHLYFPGDRERWVRDLRRRRSVLELARDRLAFPLITLSSSTTAQRLGLMPLDAERLRAVLSHAEGRVLDIGCGDNLVVAAHGDGRGLDVVDWGHVDDVIREGDLLPYGDGQFDTVCFAASLGHVSNREAMLAETYRVLRPGGLVLVTMIAPWVGWVVHRLRRRQDPDQHVRGIGEGELLGMRHREVAQLLVHAGFRAVERRGFVWGLNRLYKGRRPQQGSKKV